MKVRYQYPSPSMCLTQPGHTTLGFSPDLSREEPVSFRGKLKNPLLFRDAMLMLREIVVSDSRTKKKERVEFFQWLEGEIDRRVLQHQQYMPEVREQLKQAMADAQESLDQKDREIRELAGLQREISREIEKYNAWGDYNKLEREFWKFIRHRDSSLWFVLDPVITVHPDQVSFEAFSQDESIYGCLSIRMDQFQLMQQPALGTTNIDFSAKLAREMERFRTYNDVELSVNPGGFTVDTGAAPRHVEKKIDLPDTWIKGFNQVSSAASLSGGISLDLSPVDLYDICSFLRRHKANKSPRYMKWIMEKGSPVRILFEPFGEELTLSTVYQGEKNREEKIWGRRRWLVAEKLLPLAKGFRVRLLGFGMPQFLVADLGGMEMTIGFSSWSANDWVKGTSFNIMGGYIGDGSYRQVYPLLKERRAMPIADICRELSGNSKRDNIAGIGSLLKRGEAYFDAATDKVRFRQLTSEPIPRELYETTPAEQKVQELLDQGMERFVLRYSEQGEYLLSTQYTERNKGAHSPSITIDSDGQITSLKCSCRDFNRGPRNISAPCPHILALYVTGAKFTRLKPEPGKEYRTNDIMELLI